MKVFIFNVDGVKLCLTSIDDVLETLKDELKESFSKITITPEEMSEEEFKNLPEFDGF